MNFKLRNLYPASFLWRVLIYNSLIAVSLILIRILVVGQLTIDNIVITFIYSHFIGWSLALPLQFITKQYEHFGVLAKSITVFFGLLIFGTIGSLAGYLLVHHVFYLGVEIVEWWQLLMFLLVLAFFFGLLAFFYFNLRYKWEKTVNSLKEKEIEQERLKKLQKSAELEALRSKLDPHFLFNTLNSIASLIRIEPDKAERMVEKLSALFRYTLTSGDKKTVPLEEEIIIIKNYLEIEKIRLESRLNFQIDVDPSLYNWPVPPLLIQPIIENSIIHGIGKKVEGGIIKIEAKELNKQLRISISDNGVGFDNLDSPGGFGLKSIKDRLNIMYKKRAMIQIDTKDGTVTTIILPNEA